MKKKKQVRRSFGIIGLGRFGHALAMELLRADEDVVVLDREEEKIREMREFTDNAFVVHNLEKNTLLETGIQNCDIAIVCIGEQLDISILTTLHLVSLGIPRVIAKATGAEHGEILERLGAEVVYPERDLAIRLGNCLHNEYMLDYIRLGDGLNISKLVVPHALVGKTVKEADLRNTYGLNIVAIETEGTLNQQITPAYQFRPGDILFVAGSTENIHLLSSLRG